MTKRPVGSNRTKDDLVMEIFDKEKAIAVWPEDQLSPREKSLVGKTFGKWEVRYPTVKTKNNRKYVCHCECGTVRAVNAASLRANRTLSCGCKGQNADGIKLEPGMTWGSIKILEDTGRRTLKGEIIFKCEDPDGVIFEEKSTNIKNGNTKSAGLSARELEIYRLLKTNGYKVVPHYKACLNEFIGTFDFYVKDKYFIEYDGEQHFTKGLFNDDDLTYIRTHDKQKNHYCFENNIPLIRIPYAKKEIKLEDVLLETSTFVLTKEKEQEYYDTY
jgi:hypothetical protein